MKKVGMGNLRRLHRPLEDELVRALRRVVSNSSFILGDEVSQFENEFAATVGTKFAVAVGSATDAITFSLISLGVGRGDEVITTPLSAFPTAEAIMLTGADPVFVDIDEKTFNIDPEKIVEAIGPNTKAVVPVHLYGRSAEIQEIGEICDKHDLWLIEDCAQAQGATCSGLPVGSWGDGGCFSFFPSKNLGGFGDGGMITTDRKDVAEMAQMLRNHGRKERYEHEFVGRSSRLSGLHAAMLRVKLPLLEEHNEKRRFVARRYKDEIINPLIRCPEDDPGHVYHLYVVRVRAEERDRFRSHLLECGVATQIHYPIPLHQQPATVAFFGGKTQTTLPVIEKVVGEIVSIPMHPVLFEKEIDQVIVAVNSFR